MLQLSLFAAPRRLVARLAALGAALVVALSPALALEAREAEAVVGIMETLTEEMGEGMSAGGARIFYDYDSLGASLIPAAGFDRASWRAAYDAVVGGYLASLPQPVFDAVFEAPLARLEAAQLPDEQKALLRAHMAELQAEAQLVREAGAAHVDRIRPLEHRLHALFQGAFGE